MHKGILLLFISLLMTLTAKAQDQDVEHITLQEAIEIALENNYQLKQARNELDFAEYQEFSAKADFFPSLNGSANGQKRIGRQFNQTTGDFGDFTINGFSTSISTSLTIFNGFQNINNLRSSQYSRESTEEAVQRARESIIFETASGYLQVLLDEQLLEIARENLESSQKQLEQVRAQVEVGSRPTVDLYNQESIVANNELEVTNRENDLSNSRIRLIRSLQIDPLQEYNFAMPEITDDQVMPSDYDLKSLVNAALESRSDLRREQLNIRAVEHQLKATRASLYPSLNFSASFSSSYNDQNFIPGTGELVGFSDQYFDQNVNRSFGLSLNIPIFDNFNRRTNIQSQLVNYKNQQLALENTELQVIQEVNQAYTDYQAIVKRLESTEKALKAAERSYETEQQRYEVGASTLIELSTANAQYVEAQSNRAQALYNFVFQEKLLDYYIGKLDQNISFN